MGHGGDNQQNMLNNQFGDMQVSGGRGNFRGMGSSRGRGRWQNRGSSNSSIVSLVWQNRPYCSPVLC